MIARWWAWLQAFFRRREVKALRDHAATCDDLAKSGLFSPHASMRHRWHACRLRDEADAQERGR